MTNCCVVTDAPNITVVKSVTQVSVTKSVINIAITKGVYGIVGPQGPPGQSSGGAYAIASQSANIPLGQLFTKVLFTADGVLTLPPISLILVFGITTEYLVINKSGFNCLVQGSGGDTVEDTNNVLVSPRVALSFLATESGWEIV